MTRPLPFLVLFLTVVFLSAPAVAQFEAIGSINVTGSGLVSTESDYVPNVVHCENGLASFEALKAQAVAARTFAYYKMDSQGFINDGTSDQVYTCGGSAGSIHYQAAQATEGEILWVRDNIGSQNNVLIASFYVAGAIPSGPFNVNSPGVIVEPGDSDPTSTEQWVTYPYANGETGGNNLGTPLGFQGTPANPNWPNRGAMSQNGSDYLSDNSLSYIDILKYYYGADIELRTARTAGTGEQFSLKTLVDFDDYTGSTDPTIDGHEGTFHRSPTYSGSTTANLAGSTADRSSAEAHSGSHSQLIDMVYDEGSGTDFFLRHISGARYGFLNGGSDAAHKMDNLQFEAIGSVGFWLKTDDPGLSVSLALDDPSTGERGIPKAVIADNQWHRYQWFLEEDSEWEAWTGGGDGTLGSTNVSLDSIQFWGSADAQVYLDDVFWDPQAVYVPPVPGDFNRDGIVNQADLSLWEAGYGLSSGAGIGDGDANGDGRVDSRDFLIWQQNQGMGTTALSSGSQLASVPEPGGLLLVTFSIGLNCFGFRVTKARIP